VGGDACVTLEAVRDAALADASSHADRTRRAAEERAEQIIADGRAEAASVVARHRAAAESLADLEERARLAEARTQAHAVVLQAQRSVLRDATEAAHARARQLADDPRYERLIEHLVAEARERLGTDSEVELIAAPEGGVVARAGSRQLDYSLHAQVDRCLEALASELERLWR
jgi:vacuolar-type H+-ATPase subunit E/Vma4